MKQKQKVKCLETMILNIMLKYKTVSNLLRPSVCKELEADTFRFINPLLALFPAHMSSSCWALEKPHQEVIAKLTSAYVPLPGNSHITRSHRVGDCLLSPSGTELSELPSLIKGSSIKN